MAPSRLLERGCRCRPGSRPDDQAVGVRVGLARVLALEASRCRWYRQRSSGRAPGRLVLAGPSATAPPARCAGGQSDPGRPSRGVDVGERDRGQRIGTRLAQGGAQLLPRRPGWSHSSSGARLGAAPRGRRCRAAGFLRGAGARLRLHTTGASAGRRSVPPASTATSAGLGHSGPLGHAWRARGWPERMVAMGPLGPQASQHVTGEGVVGLGRGSLARRRCPGRSPPRALPANSPVGCARRGLSGAMLQPRRAPA